LTLADYHRIGTPRFAGQSLDRELHHRVPFKFPVLSAHNATKPLIFARELRARRLIFHFYQLSLIMSPAAASRSASAVSPISVAPNLLATSLARRTRRSGVVYASI
jgi:hypothetical protein